VLFVLAEKAEPELKARLLAQLQQIQHRISRELGRARASGEAHSGVSFAPATDLPLLIDTVQAAHQRRLPIDWNAPPGPLPFEQNDMLELLGNLLDNACKWARSSVALTIAIKDKVMSIQVEDDGPGIAPEIREEMLRRGARLDESVEGHGLGLGIVSDMVSVYHGTITLGTGSYGGLLVEIQLPLPYEAAA
jgi:signal transduction histidine kinase